MSQQFQHLTTNTYEADLYPESGPSQGSTTPLLGVCFSGGGSRALSCALGQLSALNSMLIPNSKESVLSQVPYISSVSGGSWASVLYTFLPETINGQPVGDSDFLIQPVAPESLFKGDPSASTSGNVSYMGPFCLGTVPQQFNPVTIAAFLYTLFNWGFFGDPSRWSWFWIAGVGEIVLKPFGLYDAFYNPNNSYIEPSNFFSLSEAHVDTSITPDNPTLTSSQFYLCRPNRPALIVNTNLIENYSVAGSPQIPIQATPIASGISGESPDGSIVGGGGVESFAFTSTLIGAGTNSETAAVAEVRRYSLCDITGCSSAFFATILLTYLNQEIGNVIDELEDYLINTLGFSEWWAEVIGTALEIVAEAFLDAEAAQVIPQYNYWPLSEVGESNPANVTYGFSDGGDFEDNGILGMLAQTGANRLISFVNSETPLGTDSTSGEVIVDSSLPLLFGYQDTMEDGEYVSFGGMNPSEPMSYVQVFSDEGNAFATLRQGLYDASSGGSSLGTATASFLQTLTTVDNPVANIEGGRQVTVLWVYNNRVNTWQGAIADPAIQLDLQNGQLAQPTGPLANFPNYFTGEQVFLDQEAVNMLAQLSAWNVQQLESEILGLLA
jgi:hypothetical protein